MLEIQNKLVLSSIYSYHLVLSVVNEHRAEHRSIKYNSIHDLFFLK